MRRQFYRNAYRLFYILSAIVGDEKPQPGCCAASLEHWGGA